MKPRLSNLLLRKPEFLFVSLALALSGVGSAFTSIAVYAELSFTHASAMFYSLAFIFGLVPGFITSRWAGKQANKVYLGKWMAVAQLSGAALLVFPLMESNRHNLWFLLSAEIVGSAVAGVLAPIYQSFQRRVFQNDELPYVSVYGVYLFGLQFIFGQGLGTLLYSALGTSEYLSFDLLTYLVAAAVLVVAARLFPKGLMPIEESSAKTTSFGWKDFSPIQRRVFWMMPLLSILCVPSMSYLPARGAELGIPMKLGPLVLVPALLFLLFRTLGQLIGPLIVKKANFDRYVSHNFLLVSCAVAYLSFYWVIFTASSIVMALICIVLAHVASNVIYTVASYGFSRHFNEKQIGWAASKNYQWSVAATALSSVMGGWVTEYWPAQTLVLIGIFPLAAWWHHLASQKETKEGFSHAI
jgi:MFS transporter, DHA3 family, macrolide efflux protein